SSRGIGAGIAERLAAEGADVVITARTLQKHDHLAGSLQDTAKRLEQYGGTVGIVVADLTDEADRARIIPEAEAALGGPVGIRVNTVEPRAAVMSEGAEQLVGGKLRPDQIETMEQMVEGTLALCDCPADLTGRICVSLDLIDQLGLTVHDLDGTRR